MSTTDVFYQDQAPWDDDGRQRLVICGLRPFASVIGCREPAAVEVPLEPSTEKPGEMPDENPNLAKLTSPPQEAT